MPELPTGTVTFLLTDVEGSTRLWEHHPDAMRGALARHDALAGEIVARHDGVLVKSRGEGDSLFLVFGAPHRAVAAALALQQAFHREPWPPETPLRVRMAIHTGEADLRGGDYYGPTVNRAARLRAIGHGGQTILSAATHQFIRDALPPDVALRDMGTHKLKDLQRPEQVYQLLHPELPSEFVPLVSLNQLPNNLPQQLTSFIGRERELAEVKTLLAENRLLTLTGAGGTGKTRLALQAAADVSGEFPDGVWLTELAAITEPALLPKAIAMALSLREEPGKPLDETLLDYLRPRSLLLLLDNCEHLIAACAALVDQWLRACPNVRVLATSREPMQIAGERAWRVPSLELPRARQSVSVETLLKYGAVRLFVERATLAQPSFALTSQNAPAVTQVCAQLDGIPLALELAAARVKVLKVDQIAARLDDRFRLLTGGSRTALPRQQTLRALIDWSYELLDDQEKTLLRRLSVFAGGWTLEAAEAIGGDTAEALDGSREEAVQPVIEAWQVLDLLTQLVDKSLVMMDEMAVETDAGGGIIRYRLLETVRQYGLFRLEEAREAEALQKRHTGWFAQMAQEAQAHLIGEDEVEWLERLEADHDNLRQALNWLLHALGRQREAVAMAANLWRYWDGRGHLMEGSEMLEAAIALPEEDTPCPERAEALKGAGNLALGRGEYDRARTRFEQSLALYEQQGDQLGVAAATNNLGIVELEQERWDAAQTYFQRSLELLQSLNMTWGEAMTLGNLGVTALNLGNYREAQAYQEQSLALRQTLGDRRGEAIALHNLGTIADRQGNAVAACRYCQESLAIKRDLGDRDGLAETMEELAQIMAAIQPEHAASLFGMAQSLREAIGAPLAPSEQRWHDERLSRVRTALGAAAFDEAWTQGTQQTQEQAIAFALNLTI